MGNVREMARGEYKREAAAVDAVGPALAELGGNVDWQGVFKEATT
jgi:hypothetical protein